MTERESPNNSTRFLRDGGPLCLFGARPAVSARILDNFSSLERRYVGKPVLLPAEYSSTGRPVNVVNVVSEAIGEVTNKLKRDILLSNRFKEEPALSNLEQLNPNDIVFHMPGSSTFIDNWAFVEDVDVHLFFPDNLPYNILTEYFDCQSGISTMYSYITPEEQVRWDIGAQIKKTIEQSVAKKNFFSMGRFEQSELISGHSGNMVYNPIFPLYGKTDSFNSRLHEAGKEVFISNYLQLFDNAKEHLSYGFPSDRKKAAKRLLLLAIMRDDAKAERDLNGILGRLYDENNSKKLFTLPLKWQLLKARPDYQKKDIEKII